MGKVKVEYYGHACFRLTCGGQRIVLDPYSDGSVPGLKKLRTEAEFVYCSHDHHDHNAVACVKLKAGAPSIHMIRVDIDAEISPMVGGEQQSQELITYLSGEDPDKLWESNIFGRSVYELIREGLTAKVIRMPEDVRGKFRGSLQRIVNEGATGLICLIL